MEDNNNDRNHPLKNEQTPPESDKPPKYDKDKRLKELKERFGEDANIHTIELTPFTAIFLPFFLSLPETFDFALTLIDLCVGIVVVYLTYQIIGRTWFITLLVIPLAVSMIYNTFNAALEILDEIKKNQ